MNTNTPPKTKVLYLITKSNWGGAQRYIYDLVTHLDHDQFEPVVALGGDGVLAEQLRHVGVHVITIASLERDVSLRKEFAFARELWQILRAEQPHVLHVNSSKAGGVGTLLGRLARVPRVIFTAHGWAFNEDRPWHQRTLIKLLHWLTVLFSHQTIAVSRAIVAELNWPLAPRKMRVINPGRTIGAMYERRDARAKLQELAPAIKSGPQDIWLLTIAELHPIKRLSTLIAALAHLSEEHPRLRAILIGDGELRQTLAAEIHDAGLSDRVFLTGPITEAARFLKAADLFVLPSKSESYGYVVHEAGLAGVPVLASDVGGIRDIVTDEKTGRLIPPDHIPALTHALKDFLAHRETWTAYGTSLQADLATRTVERMTLQTAALYSLPLR